MEMEVKTVTFTKQIISYEKTNLFSKLFLDYTSGKSNEFHSYQATPTGIEEFVKENKYTGLNRTILVKELKGQNSELKLSVETEKNIKALEGSNAFTITTGHQLCLATGPLFFIYKILSVINICEYLNKNIPGKKFVPVYWMASEDHDVEEIRSINLFTKKISWNTTQKGKVGGLSLDGIDDFLREIKSALGESTLSVSAMQLLEAAYTKKDLASATRYLVNELFGKYGLVIIDGNKKTFKEQFKDEFRRDIFENKAFTGVTGTIEKLGKLGYDSQVNPREINVFYAEHGLRERIVKEDHVFKVLGTEMHFTKEEMEKLISERSECLSPNVVLRPLYQQKILPNAAYVGGPGEIAYWLQYKDMFADFAMPLPVLVPRNFILYIEKNLQQRMEKLRMQATDVFMQKEAFVKSWVVKQHAFNIDKEKEELIKTYQEIRKQISGVDKTLEASVEADLQRTLKGLEALEQKAIRAIKLKNEQALQQIENIYQRLLPGGVPQDRVENFLRYYTSIPDFIGQVKNGTTSFFEEVGVVVLKEN